MNNLAVIIGITLMYSAPLIFTAMGGILSENTGVVNIGLEGMMTIGALIGATVTYYSHNPWLGFLCAGLAGMGLALIHAIATIWFSADQVVSGTAINLIGPGLALFLSRIFFEGAAMTKPIAFEDKMPQLFANVFPAGSFLDNLLQQYATVYLAFLLVPAVWFLLNKTKLGLRMRAVGEHPRAAETLGVNVYLIKFIGVLASGFFAGLGGACLSIAVVANYRETLVSGQGFIALAAVIFGGWKPVGALLACLLFGASQGLVVYLGGSGAGFSISPNLLNMLPYILTMLTLIFFVGEKNGPGANGIPYRRHQ